MDNCANTFCKLCLSVVTDGNFKLIEDTIREVLNVLLLKLSDEENHEHVMCDACTEKLFAAFNFKGTCMDTEDSIFPYVGSENATPVDLKEIYLKLRDKEHLSNMVEGESICRLCMQFSTCGFKPIEDIDIDVIHKYIPEVNFKVTKDPVICSLCLDSLNTHSSFLKNCLDVDEKIKNNNVDPVSKSPFDIINENSEIKTDECDEYGDTFLHGNEFDDNIKTRESTLFEYKYMDSLNLKSYKCNTCHFKTRSKTNLVKHELEHKDISEVQHYVCIEEKEDEGQIYHCNMCDFETKHKRSLIVHQLKHKYFSEGEVYKCDECEFKTKSKCSLKRHQIAHKDFSEVRIYKCDSCDFETKYKISSIRHQLKHEDFSEVQIYKCNKCDFKTKYKGNLKKHLLTHKDFSERQIYKCETCDYRTKRKSSLGEHQLKHKDFSEVQTYKCATCKYVTKSKNNLRCHVLKHKDFSEVQGYKCDRCHFKSISKITITNHQVMKHNIFTSV